MGLGDTDLLNHGAHTLFEIKKLFLRTSRIAGWPLLWVTPI